ncbi:hypothetical protein QBC39DRAFT_40962 [Podospora conica]|nr:hypothetical protein QBC39DRAFT_40962 [Schizothecium conicum]
MPSRLGKKRQAAGAGSGEEAEDLVLVRHLTPYPRDALDHQQEPPTRRHDHWAPRPFCCTTTGDHRGTTGPPEPACLRTVQRRRVAWRVRRKPHMSLVALSSRPLPGRQGSRAGGSLVARCFIVGARDIDANSCRALLCCVFRLAVVEAQLTSLYHGESGLFHRHWQAATVSTPMPSHMPRDEEKQSPRRPAGLTWSLQALSTSNSSPLLDHRCPYPSWLR